MGISPPSKLALWRAPQMGAQLRVGVVVRARRLGVVVVSACVVVAGLVGSPAVAADNADGPQLSVPKSAPNKNTDEGSSSETGLALAKAAETKKSVEIVSARTATVTVLANPDGTLTRETAQAPIRAKNSSGDFVPVDTDLKTAGQGLAPANTTKDTTYSSDGSGDLVTLSTTKDTSVGLSMAGDLGAPSVTGPVATYGVKGNPGESVSVGAVDNGFEAHVVLDAAPGSGSSTGAPEPSATEQPSATPPSGTVEPQSAGADAGAVDGASDAAPVYTFDLKLEGLTARLVDGRLELTNAKGDVVAGSRPLQMWDSAVDAAGDPSNVASVDAKLTQTATGARLQLTPSMTFLTDPSTKYPVTIDPDITVAVNGDTWYYSGQTSADNKSDDPKLAVGSPDGSQQRRALIYLPYHSYLGQTVTSASLNLWQYYAASCTAKQLDLYPVKEDVPSPIWDNQPAIDSDARWSSVKSFNHGATGCAEGFESIDITPMVNAWAGGFVNGDTRTNNRQGVRMRANNETDTTQEKRFCSHQPSSTGGSCNTTARIPVLSVTYRPALGSQSWYSMTNHTLNDRSSLSVNNATGNLVVGANDLNVNGVGLNLSVARSYNSQTKDTTSLGKGWNLSLGPDVWLEKMSTYRYDYHGPSGAVLGSFVRKSSDAASLNYNMFSTPIGGVDADLDQNPTDGTFTLKFHHSRTTYTFTDNSPDANAYMTKVQDRSGNATTLAYSGTTAANKPKLSTITDSSSRTYTVTYTGDYITKIANTATGPGLREWQYGYSSGYLTSYTDPSGAVTNYAYHTVTSGPDLLDTITDPVNQSGKRPTATITYGYDSGTDVNQVTKVSYRYGDGSTDLYNYTWDYRTTIPTRCSGNGTMWTVVTDPNAHDTTYCFKPRTDDATNAKTWVYDALGNAKSTDYSADNGPMNVTDPSGQNVANGSTVATYAPGIADRLDKVTAPNSGAANKATTGFAYDPAGNGGNYQPTKTKDTSGNCTSFGYDSKGRTTDAYTGIAATSEDPASCSSTSSKGFHRDYDNATGNVIKSWDANSGGGTPADADSTIYTYWASGDTGYVSGTKDQLKAIRKPGGDCSATVAAGRKLCTSYTYDGAGRVISVTNGNAIATTYKYDKLDRTTGAYFNGATSCNLLGGGCLQYTYDAEGNLTRRTGDGETSTFDYDRLNRQTAITTPVGLLKPNDQIGIAYDGTGNLTTYTQSVGGVNDSASYSYDTANRLTTVTDSTGTTNITSNVDGRTESITYPKPTGTNGTKVAYDYTSTGKPKTLDIKTQTDAGKGHFAYDYTKFLYGGLFQVETSQMQHRTVTAAPSNLNTDVAYAYNTDNQLTGADAATGTDYTYQYDNVGNVTKEQGSATTNYGYDRAGELCWQGPNTGTNLAQVCPATPTGDTTVNHDPAGNSTNTTADPIAYNTRDQVTTIGGTAMTYRDLGNDLRAKTGTTRTVAGPIGITATTNGSTATFYTRDPQGTILNSHDTTGTRNYVTEYNGSVAALYNPSGTAVGTYKYTPYGATTVAAETGGTTAATNPFRYISGYQDKTNTGTDNYYKLGARYYDGAGHFTQPDPAAAGGGSYNYANGDPINSSDPSGMYPGEGAVEAVGHALEAAGMFAVKAAPYLVACGGTGAIGLSYGLQAGLVFPVVGQAVLGAAGFVGGCAAGLVATALGGNPFANGIGGPLR